MKIDRFLDWYFSGMGLIRTGVINVGLFLLGLFALAFAGLILRFFWNVFMFGWKILG